MKTVGIREFRDHATKYLAGSESLTIERHGQTVGYFIPAKRKRSEELKRGFNELNEMIEEILVQTGMSREEFEELMATPVPDDEEDDIAYESARETRRAAGD